MSWIYTASSATNKLRLARFKDFPILTSRVVASCHQRNSLRVALVPVFVVVIFIVVFLFVVFFFLICLFSNEDIGSPRWISGS